MMLQDNVLKNISDIDGQIEDFKAKNDQCTKKFLNFWQSKIQDQSINVIK
jgi:hypothetical protein